jgi:hypothetical protein
MICTGDTSATVPMYYTLSPLVVVPESPRPTRADEGFMFHSICVSGPTMRDISYEELRLAELSATAGMAAIAQAVRFCLCRSRTILTW